MKFNLIPARNFTPILMAGFTLWAVLCVIKSYNLETNGGTKENKKENGKINST
jgi:hypothetical protein